MKVIYEANVFIRGLDLDLVMGFALGLGSDVGVGPGLDVGLYHSVPSYRPQDKQA